MNKEDKQLLLKDLCARLPYGVKFLRESWNYEWDQEMSVIEVLEDIDKDGYVNNTKVYTVEDIKPFLRPLYSLTEEEKKEFYKVVVHESWDIDNISPSVYVADWQYSKHLDVHGLIPKGLAIEVTKENNPYDN